MDFHSLSRRELQALCKRNKIPANVTNVVMADSLQALNNVEGIDEVLQACKSEISQSSIEPRLRSEVTSPYVPPTGGRSISRINTATKLDSMLKKCAQNEKNKVLLTPAPSGAASGRRALKESSAMKQVYGTRRSARLAEKSARLLKGVGNDNSDSSGKDLFIVDGQEFKMNLNASLDCLDEISGVTESDDKRIPTAEEETSNHSKTEPENCVKFLSQVGDENPVFFKKDLPTEDCLILSKGAQDGLHVISGVPFLNEYPEKEGEIQIDSGEKQAMSIEEDPLTTTEVEMGHLSGNEFESQLKEGCNMETMERGNDSHNFVEAVDAEAVVANYVEKDESVAEKILLPGVQEYQSNIDDAKKELNERTGSEIEQVVDKNTDDDGGSLADDVTEKEVSSDDNDFAPKPEVAAYDNKEDLELNIDSSTWEPISDETDSINLDLIEGSTKTKDSEISSISYKDDDVAVEEEIESVQLITTDAPTTDHVPCNPLIQPTDAPLCEEALNDHLLSSLKNYPTHELAAASPKNIMKNEAFPLFFTELDDLSLTVQPTLFTPKRASASRFQRSSASDNKENIGSGNRTAPAKERSKIEKKLAESIPRLDDQSVMELEKHMKRLIIEKSNKHEGEVEVTVRTALQPLSENQKAEQTSD